MIDIAVLFDEIEICPGVLATWRAEVFYADPQNWQVTGLSTGFVDFTPINRWHPMWPVLLRETEVIRKAQVIAAGIEATGPHGDPNGEHRLGPHNTLDLRAA